MGKTMLMVRVRTFLAEAPIFFIGAVIAIAVVFRIGLGFVKPAAAEPEPFASHFPVPVAPVATSSATPAEATPAVAPEPVDPTMSAPKPQLPRKKKPRTLGKR